MLPQKRDKSGKKNGVFCGVGHKNEQINALQTPIIYLLLQSVGLFWLKCNYGIIIMLGVWCYV